MKYFYGQYKRGIDTLSEGKIVISHGKIMISYTPKMNHNYLIKSLISKFKLKDVVQKDVLRLNYVHEGERIVIFPAREVDDEIMEKNIEKYADLIKSNLI